MKESFKPGAGGKTVCGEKVIVQSLHASAVHRRVDLAVILALLLVTILEPVSIALQ